MELHMDICVKALGPYARPLAKIQSRSCVWCAIWGCPLAARGVGSWRALPEDLKRWILSQRNQHLPEPLRQDLPQ